LTNTPGHTPSRIDNVRRAFKRTFSALDDDTFRRIWAFGGFYYTYRATELAVLSWFVLTLTDSELQVAMVGVSRIAPMFLFGLTAGNLSDRFNRPRLMAIGQASNLAAAAVMVGLLMTGSTVAWHAYALIFATGFTWALDYASRRALLGELFSGRALTNATSLDAGLVTGSNMVGPLLGTMLIHWADFLGAYIGVTLLTASAFLVILSIRSQPRQHTYRPRGTPINQVRESLSIVWKYPTLLAAVLVTITFNVFGWPFIQMVSVIARDILGRGEISFGLLVSALGAGSLVGAAGLAWAQPTNRGAVYTLGTGGIMASATAFAWSPWFPLAMFWMFVAGLSLAAFAVMQPSIALEAVPPELRGRAMGAIVLGIGFQAGGMAILGGLAESIGPREAVTAMAVTGIVVILLLRRRFPVLRSPLPHTIPRNQPDQDLW
jgi:MFS family permease